MAIIQRGEAGDALLAVGRLTIDLRARQVHDVDHVLDLTGKEFDLLAFLAARPGHVFDRTELLRAVWQSTPEWQQPATVTEHVRRLRAKIEIDPRHPLILRTVRGSGYRLDLPGTETPDANRVDDDQIRTGLADDAFVVHYQPTVALTDDLVIGMEALVRWDHPDRGLLTPDAFIAAAERSGAIIELGDVVFEKACTQAAEWRHAGMDLMLSVNLSARQLAEPALYDRIVTVLASTGLDPARLSLEVTETALIEDVDGASAVLHRLADLGISIAIDDFGTGWASLTYLRNFPIRALKIDRSFVAGVGSNANDTAIARSILALGEELGLAVVAEGIETRAQQHALRELGCSIGQGFLFGRPGPASDVPVDEPVRPTFRRLVVGAGAWEAQ